MQTKHSRSPGGFTLLEMLVAMSVLALTLVLFSQIASHTMNATGLASRQIDVAAQARTAFDRIASDIGALQATNGLTLAVAKDKNGINDGIALMARSRVLKGTSGAPRFAVVSFKIGDSVDPAMGGTEGATVSMLHWGNGTQDWNVPYNSANSLVANLKTAAASLAGSAVPPPVLPSKTFVMGYNPVAPNIFRFEISFLLDDGTIVNDASLVNDQNFDKVTGAKGVEVNYLALSDKTAPLPLPNRYVKALIIGMAGISGDVRQLIGPAGVTSLIAAFPNPNPASLTPLQMWDINGGTPAAAAQRGRLDPPKFPKPVLNNVRVYQRYFYVK